MGKRVNNKVFGTTERPRLVVYRSLNYIHAQLVDDVQRKTVMGFYNKSKVAREALKELKNKTEAAHKLGQIFADEAKKKNIKEIVFDRNGYLYHGRVKAFAEGAREGGLKF